MAVSVGTGIEKRNIHLAGIVDEGGGIMAGLAAGVRGPIALIGVSEKGYLTVEFTVHSQPGHSSTPPPQTAIGILSKAMTRLEAHPMPTHLRRLRPITLIGSGRYHQLLSLTCVCPCEGGCG
jgi:carboxypeptidase PM20D1